MRKCRFCSGEIETAAIVCPHCQRDLIPGRSTDKASVPAAPNIWEQQSMRITEPDSLPLTRVSVVDVNMPFASMVGFMVKWSLAAIPAIMILFALGLFMAGLLAAFARR